LVATIGPLIQCRKERSVNRLTTLLLLLGTASLACTGHALAQQFNSDSYLSKQHGMATVILTYGDRNSIFMNTFSLLPRWEFTAAVYLYDADHDPKTDDGYSTTFYAKYMFYENHAKTGGFAMKAGTGMDPGYLSTVGLKDAFQTYWTNAPATLPLFNNKLSWDIMPGASVTVPIVSVRVVNRCVASLAPALVCARCLSGALSPFVCVLSVVGNCWLATPFNNASISSCLSTCAISLPRRGATASTVNTLALLRQFKCART
jgi:hypothetical protein